MAVIGKIRQHSVILLVVVAVALLAFIVGDFVKPGNKHLSEFIKIGKQNVDYYTFMDQYNYYSEILKQNGAENVEAEANNYTFNEMVDSLILQDQYRYLGITITAEEIRDLMVGPNPHQYARRFFGGPDGNYDMQLAQGFLDNMDQYDSASKANYLYIERLVEKEAFRNKYLNLLAKSFYTPKIFARKAQEESQMRANLQLAQISYSHELVSDDKITVKEEDMQKWYEENIYRFPQDEELRNIEYVLFEIKPSAQDLQDIENEVREKYAQFLETESPKMFINSMVDARFDSTFYKRNELPLHIDTLLFDAPVGTFIEPFIEDNYWMFAKLLDTESRPDSLHVSFMFFAYEGMQDAPRTKEQTQNIIDSAFLALVNGQNFYEVANQFSDIKADPQNDSLRVWLADGSDMVFFDRSTAQEFFDTLNRFSPGIMTKYEAEAGTWIFILNHKTEIEKKIKVAIGKKIIEASSETFDNIESAANNFVNGTDTYKKFDKKVNDLGLNKRSFERLTAMAYNIPGISVNAREIIRWAFDEKTEKGAVSAVFLLNDVFVVASLKDIYPKGHMALDQVRPFVESMVKREKKAEILTKTMKATLAKTKDIHQIANQYKLNVDTIQISFADRNFGHYGPEAGLIGKIFAQQAGQELILMKGDMGMYLIRVLALNIPSSLQMDENGKASTDMYLQQQGMMYQSKVQNSAMPALKKLYKIEDNRHKVF
ncbi:MAG: SurA N-terminal domain-containing protein [Bacteroidales bacterium]|jgi:peptidyl-prolyl cis-trans isomerase D|nr:SurA N-terminal domain-containing protein [Bacteroidales bacterium]MDD2687106.1 SurA N-terminal domain-containing protein [Bacteroidales bacterium]MDD3330534.1 SurA N-terminal domain-containing protein [Bacteroidales bacterium]MDD3691812.1 SurA N-terminal domain-containing protein [Bacteroidales bacterium]MDD4044750.1 SurA N-terminal domain-containing protein [Bacteroidales bacterium]